MPFVSGICPKDIFFDLCHIGEVFMERACWWEFLRRLIVVGFVGGVILSNETIVWGQRGALRELTAPAPRWHAPMVRLRIDDAIDEKFDLSTTNGLPKLLEAV